MLRSLTLAAVALSVLVAAGRWGSFVAGGSDSYCYLYQAERWASGRLQVVEPLALSAPWPAAPLAFTPVGHRPSTTVPGAIVPICPPGLSIAMAPFLWVGGRAGAFLVVPLFGVLLVLATNVVGSRYGARIGLASAVLTAASPAFLYQVIQPMTDVPAAALWMLALACATSTARRHSVTAGLAASAAILVRPNLTPLGIVIGLFFLLRPEQTWRMRMSNAAMYALWCAPGCLAVVLIQQLFHGAPLASGYGAPEAFFSASNIVPNLARYPRWLVEAHTPMIVLAAVAPFLLPGTLTWTLVGLFLVNLASYLPYHVFQDWSFLRFLLPTIPILLILMNAVLDDVWRRLGFRRTSGMLIATTVVLSVVFVRAAEPRNVFRLRQIESRFERAGNFVAERMPQNALVITSWHSGSVRFYSGRLTIAWGGLPNDRLEEALAFVRARGFKPYFLLESWEEPGFREKFAASPLGALDWPPMAELAPRVRIYEPGDRELFRRGAMAPTIYAR